MTVARLLLDEVLSPAIAEQLVDRGHDVLAVVADPALRRLPDVEVLALATDGLRAVVTPNIRDFVVLDRQWKAQGRAHSGVVLVATSRFPQDVGSVGAVVRALDAAATSRQLPQADETVFLQPR